MNAHLGRGASTGVLIFAVACIVAQFLRPDLDWLHAPLSFYLVGHGGYLLKAAYFVLSASIAAIGIGCYRALSPAARSAAPLLLFLLAAVALDATALCDTATKAGDLSLHAFLHNVAALTTFTTITAAMLLQSWRLRGDAAWRARFVPAMALAVAASVALAVYSLTHVAPRGLLQKLVVVLILAWLARTSTWLTRDSSR